MNKKLLILLYFINIYTGYAQKAPAFPELPFKSLSVENFFSIVPDYLLESSTGKKKLHLEHMYNVSLFTNLNRKWQLGLHYTHVWTRYDHKPVDRFLIAGILGRYNHILSEKTRFYAETGINLGNYCQCLHDVTVPDELPFKEDNMIFNSYHLGILFKVTKNLSFRVGVGKYLWLNKNKTIYYGGLNIPVIGLSFTLLK